MAIESVIHSNGAPPAKSAGSVPVIDLRKFDLDQHHHEAIVRQMAEASSDWGFFQVVNHGIDVEFLEEVMSVSRSFLELPHEAKMKWAAKTYLKDDGYGSKGNGGYFRDYVLLNTLPNRNTDNWPDHPPEYKKTLTRLSDEFLKLAKKIYALLSEGIGFPETYIENSLGEPKQSILTNFYPPHPEPEEVIGFVPHSDYGGLTLLLQDISGLQVLRDNGWVVVDPIPGAITINISDLLELMSNGRYKSVTHRVRPNKCSSRLSIASNYSCSFETTISPAPELIDADHPQLYKPVKFGDYVAALAKDGPKGKSYMMLPQV